MSKFTVTFRRVVEETLVIEARNKKELRERIVASGVDTFALDHSCNIESDITTIRSIEECE